MERVHPERLELSRSCQLNMKRVVSVLCGLVAAAALWFLYSRFHGAAWRPALSSREVATRILASHLAQRYPGAKVLVVGNPFTQRSGQASEIYAFEEASVQGLRTGFGGAPEAVKVVYPDLRPQFLQNPQSVFVDPKTTTPLSFLVADDAFDRLLAADPERQVVVTLIGVPVNLRDTQAWRNPESRHLALLFPDWRFLGNQADIVTAFKSGKLAAAVVNKPGAVGLSSPVSAGDVRGEFDRRFLLVTSDNIEKMFASYPRAF